MPWALALGVLLPAAATESMSPATNSLSSFVALQAQYDLKALGKEIVQHLSGKKPASLPELDRRLREIEARLSTGAMLESEAADVRSEVQRLSTLLSDTAALAAGPGGAVTPKVQALVRNVAGVANGGGVETVAVLMSGLRDVAAKPEDAARIFDNLRRQFGDPKLSAALTALDAGSGRDAVLVAVTGKSEPIAYTDPVLLKKVTDLKGGPIPPPLPPGQSWTPKRGVKDAVDAAANPFFSLMPDARERKFSSDRASQRETLLSQGRDALRACGVSPESFPGLAAMVARLAAAQADILRQMGLTKPAQDFAEEQRRLESISQVNRPLALYLVALSRYRVLMQSALLADAIPDGTPLEPWELGQPESAAPGATITFYVEREGAETYTGFLYNFSDGTSRFQGQSREGDTGLMVVRTPGTGKTVRTVVAFDEKHEATAAHTRVVDEKTGRVVREEIADIARKLTTLRTWDDAGTLTQEIKENNGARSLKDFNNGFFLETTADKRAKISALPGQAGKGPAQFKYQYGTLNDDGSITVTRVELENGTNLLMLGQGITKIVGADGQASGYEVDLAEFAKGGRGEARTAASRKLARAIVEALGIAVRDEVIVPLANFLRDLDEYAPNEGYARVHMSIDRNNSFHALTFRLIYDRRDGTKRMIAGQLGSSTAFKGHVTHSLIIAGAIEVDADHGMSQDRPGYWREYTSEETRLEWSSKTRDEEKGWGPWSHTDTKRDVILKQQTYVSGCWREKDQEFKKTLTEKEGKTFFGEAGAGIMNVKYLGASLDFCGKVGKTLYTGIVAAPQEIITAATGSDLYSIEAGGSYAKNPLINQFVDDQGHLDRLTSGAREELYAKVREQRRQALDNQPYPVPATVVDQAVNAPISAKEAVDVLRDNYGASTYGKRLIHEGAQTTGFTSFLCTSGGVVMGAFEGIAESMLNPLVLATFGLGQAVGALNAAKGIAQAGWAVRTGVTALTITNKLVTSMLVTTFLLNAADDIGKTVEATAAGKFDEAYWNQWSATGTDLLFAGLMYKGWRDQQRQAKALELNEEKTTQLNVLDEKLKSAPQGQPQVAEVKADVKTLTSPEAPADVKTDPKTIVIEEPGNSGGGSWGRSLSNFFKEKLGLGEADGAVEKAKVEGKIMNEAAQSKVNAAGIEANEGGQNFKMTANEPGNGNSGLGGKVEVKGEDGRHSVGGEEKISC